MLLIASIAAAAVVSLVYAKVVNTQKADSFFADNVEALAFSEDSEYADCFTLYTVAPPEGLAVNVRICKDCSYEWVTNASLVGFCKK